MTLITGHVVDVGMAGAHGVFIAQSAEFVGSGEDVIVPSPVSFPISGGVVSAEVAPGPARLTIHVGSSRREWLVVVPESDVGLGELIELYTEYEPPVVSAVAEHRAAAEAAAAEAIAVLGNAESIQDIEDALEHLPAEWQADIAAAVDDLLGGAGAAFDTLKELQDALGSDPNFASAVTTELASKVSNTDPRLSDARTPTAHTHPVADLNATGTASSSTYLRGDGTWATPTNTTYSVMSEAEATAGTATTARTISAARLKGAIQRWATGTYSTAISTIGQALNRATTAAEARAAIGAGTSDLVIGTTASTAKAGNYQPTWAQVTGKPSTFAPTAHAHPVGDLTASGTASSTTYLRGDGTWATPANTTYSVISEAEATAGTATTARAISAAVLKGAIQRWVTGSYTTAVSSIGQALAKAADAAAARAAIGAGTSDLAIGTTASTAKAGNWTPTWAQVTGKPTTFTPAEHSHPVSQVSGLQDALDDAVATLVDNAPEALDTLSELAEALGDDPNFATTVSTQIGERAKTSDVNAALAGKADAGAENTATWSGVSGKPSTFTPSAHTHPVTDLDATGTASSTTYLRGDGTWATPASAAPSWLSITDKPSTFPPSGHTHTWASITDKPSTYTPSSHLHQWTDITDRPTTMPPSAHSHSWSSITDKPTTFFPDEHTHTWSQVVGKPSTFAPSAHKHPVTDLTTTGTPSSSTYLRGDGTWATPDIGTPTGHTHTIDQVTGLQAALDFKAPLDHTHSISQVTGLADVLGGKASSEHVHSWDDIAGKPTTFAPTSHTHQWNAITNKPSTFTPSSHLHQWTDITDRPTAMPPTAHSHTWASITDKPTTFFPSSHTHPWTEVTGKPSTFTPSAHTHAVTDLNTTGTASSTTYLRGDGTWATPAGTTYSAMTEAEANAGTSTAARTLSAARLKGAITTHTANKVDTSDPRLSDARTPTAHTHSIANVTGLQDALNSKASTSHTHSIANVAGLVTALAGKADVSHEHEIGDVTGLETTLDGKADLVDGKVPEEQLPELGASGSPGVEVADDPYQPGSDPVAGGGAAAVGYGANAGNAAVAVGQGAGAATMSVAVGHTSNAAGSYATAIGANSNATAGNSAAVGNNAKAEGNMAAAFGPSAKAAGEYTTAVGISTTATGQQSSAIGYASNATGGQSAAVGVNTTAEGDMSAAFGTYSYATGTASTAVGMSAQAMGPYSAAIGNSAAAAGDMSIAVGYGAYAENHMQITLGIGHAQTEGEFRHEVHIPGVLVLYSPDNSMWAITVDNAGQISAAPWTPPNTSPFQE